ncbi:MAG: hypothetical protein L7S67_07435 [Flavobacteriales bacterium]|nr:hypothetical protein [Flavobacteriales bacterium]
MRSLLHLSLICAVALGWNSAAAQTTIEGGETPDTAKTLTIDVHPQMVGGSVPFDDSKGGAVLRATASIHTDAPRHKAHLSIDLLQAAGAPLLRAAEAGYDRRGNAGLGASRVRARWNWTPLSSVKVVVGRDTLHDGWGRRSLFRGRHSAPVPFVETRIDGGGRLRYRHRIEALQGAPSIYCTPSATGDPRFWVPPSGAMRTGIERMVVSHRLEVDLGRRLTAALWGAVVWNTEAGTRAFEPHYLLPLTSLRPTEYAQGSSDNAIVGLEGRYRLGSSESQQRFLYGQLLIDELIVSEILGSTGWWGNKYGLLGGLHWGYPRGAWRIEASGVRPWTYSHFTPTSAYINGLTPLAHPLGANFIEGTIEGHFTRQEWTVYGRFTASRRGDDPDGNSPSGSLPQVGDIDRTAESYLWLGGTSRSFALVQLDVSRTLHLGDKTPVQGFMRWEGQRTALGPFGELGMRLIFGLRTTGPFLGADW